MVPKLEVELGFRRLEDGTFLTYEYPRLPWNTDFETFRKTDDSFKRIIEYFHHERFLQAAVGTDKRKERFIFSTWSRERKGPDIRQLPPGKKTGNGLPWAATLYDFYITDCTPKYPCYVIGCPGNELASWAKSVGELDAAKLQLRQAEMEDEPYEMQVFDIGKYIEVLEEQVWKGRVGKYAEIRREERRTRRHSRGDCLLNAYRVDSSCTTRGESSNSLSFLSAGRAVQVGSEPDVVRIYNLKLETDIGDKKGEPRKSPLELERPLAHLYISPKRQIGKGHHSFAFQVELELPRELLVQPKLCLQCALDKLKGGDGVRFIRIRKSSSSKAGEQPTVSEADVLDEPTMQQYYSFVCKRGEPLDEKDRHDIRFQIMKHLIPQVGPRYCKHLNKNVPASPSQKASVIAKLALADDKDEPHCEFLATEARNYQRFPKHLFEHWNGYNFVLPLRSPTPVGAVVPQFYGYCGQQQVDPKCLTSDDRCECFSLLRRLHLAGFVHQSVYHRNIVMQHGPLMESPFKRSSLHPRFRLIDFGRSYKCDQSKTSHEMDTEKEDAIRMLRVGNDGRREPKKRDNRRRGEM